MKMDFLRRVFLSFALSTWFASPASAASIPGELSVSQSVTPAGATSSQIPIPALPGAGGLEPKLVLSYSSQNGNNGLGLGWSLGGFSSIVRGSKTREVDGVPGPITYTVDDAFYLDGERLVPVAHLVAGDSKFPAWLKATYGAIQYRKWVDDGTLAFALLSQGGGVDSFVAETKTGLRTYFTVPVSGNPTLPAPAIYLPTKSIDTANNYILWQFTIDGLSYQLSSAAYTGLDGQNPIAPFARIDFSYEKTANPITTHLLGQAVVRTERLKSVTSTLVSQTGAAAQGLALVLNYKETNSADAFYLMGAQLKAFGDTVPPLSFNYLLPDTQWTNRSDLNAPGLPAIGGTVPSELAYRTGTTWDSSAHKTTALFLSRYGGGRPLAKTYVPTAAGWSELPTLRGPPVIFVDNAGRSMNVVLLDIDGDGYTDLIQSGPQGHVAWLQKPDQADPAGGRWVLADSNHSNPGESFAENDGTQRAIQFINLGNAPRQDLLVKEATGQYVALLNKASGWVSNSALNFKMDPHTEVVFGNFSCGTTDGRANISLMGSNLILQTFANSGTNWTQLTGGTWDWQTSAQNTVRLKSIKTGAAGCGAILVTVRNPAGVETLTILKGSSSGWGTPLQVMGPTALFSTATGTPLHPEFIDVNGDGLDDIILSEADQNGNAVIQETWIQATGGGGSSPVVFARDTKFKPPVLIADGRGRFPDTFVVPWVSNGTGAAIVTVPSIRIANGQTYLSSAMGWTHATDLTPATLLTETKEKAGSIQFVDLNSDGMQDVVYNDGESNVGAEFNSPGNGWTPAPGFIPPLPLEKSGDVGARASFIDVNGDGYIDLVYAYRENGVDIKLVYLNGIPFGTQGWLPIDDPRCQAWSSSIPAPMADVARGNLGWRFADINGDGLPDLVYGRLDQNLQLSATAYLNNGHGWDKAADFAPTVAFVFDQGDGRTLDLGTQLVDVDGDRLPALVARYRDPTHPKSGWIKTGVFRNLGGRFARSPSGSVPVMLDSAYFDSASVSFIDIDGDGNPDIVRFTANGADVYLGNGTDWSSTPSPVWQFPASAFSATLGFGASRFADVNGDGRLDILYNRPGDSGVILNSGSGWLAQPSSSPLAPPPDMPFLTNAGDDTGVRMVDVLGHGALDLIKSALKADGTPDKAVWSSPGKRAGMLSSLTESSGVITSYSYARLVDQRGMQKKAVFRRTVAGGSYPNIPLTPFSPVVDQSVTDEGDGRTVTSTYSYSDFRFDLLNSRVLGFASIERNDQASDVHYLVTHRTDFLQDPDLVGHPRVEQTLITTTGSPVVVDETRKDWTVVRQASPVAAKGRSLTFLQVLLSKSSSETHDLSGTLTGKSDTSFEYDDWLNTTRMTAAKFERATQTLTNSFDGPNYPRYGRLVKSLSEVRSPSGVLSSSRSATFTYAQDTLLLQTEALDVGDPELNSLTNHVRDVRGNIVSTTKAAASNVRKARLAVARASVGAGQRTSSVEYDSQGRLITVRINAKTQRTVMAYADGSIGAALGLATTETDPNYLATAKTYDALGRPSTVTSPDGVAHIYQRMLADQIPAGWLSGLANTRTREASHRNTKHAIVATRRPGKRAFHAGAGSSLAIGYAQGDSETGRNGKTRLNSAKIFDRRGRVIRTVTRRTDGAHVRFVFKDSQYDLRGQLIAESLPYFSGEKVYWTTYEYDELGRRTRETRPDGATRFVVYQGLTQTRTDAKGNKTIIELNLDLKPFQITRADQGVVKYSYDDLARVVSMTSPNGLQSMFQYDGAGNRILTRDPNAGEIDYRYDAFGQLREQRDGSQQWAEMDYDELGRSIRQWRPDQETISTYDAPGAVGLPSTVTLLRQNTPDALTYGETYTYDDYARLKRNTIAVQAAATLDPALATNFRGFYNFGYGPFGELTEVIYPMSVTSRRPLRIERQYDDQTGQLVKVVDARTTAGTVLWGLTSADAAGRTVETTLGNGVHDVREFDPTTGRLTSLRVVSSQHKALLADAYHYDEVGNLVSRGSVGAKPDETFDYDFQNRLVSANYLKHKLTIVRYDRDDRIVWKSGVGKYHYASDADASRFGCIPNAPPDALCAIDKDDAVTDSFLYDEFGDMYSQRDPSGHRDTDVDYTFDHHVARITKVRHGVPDAKSAAEFYYGPTGQRILSREVGCESDDSCFNHRAKETIHMGLYNRIIVKHGDADGSRVVTDRFYVAGDQGVFLALDSIDRRAAKGRDQRGPASAAIYQHHDQIGSIVMLTKDDGRAGVRVKYDPWGKPTGGLKPLQDHDDRLGVEAAWTRGFTGQDHIPEFDLIHMSGRVYDPRIGVFLSVDPLGGSPSRGGDLNPYLYAQGNPLAITDPTGFWSLGDVVNDIGNAVSSGLQSLGNAVAGGITNLVQGAAQWIGQNWREIVTVAVIAIVTVATSGAGTGPVVAAMAAGAAGGMTETALYGGTLQDVIGAGIEGAFIGALSGGVGASGWGWEGKAFVQGVVSGFQSAASGQGFERGFIIGSLSRLSPGSLDAGDASAWAVAERVAARAVVNGAISEAQGDKFANGALSGAFQQLYVDADQGQWQIKNILQAISIFKPGLPQDFGVGDLLHVVGNIQDEALDKGLRYFSSVGEPNSFLDKVQSQYNQLMGFGAQVEMLKPKPGPWRLPGTGGELEWISATANGGLSF